jgi:hypothetical protein
MIICVSCRKDTFCERARETILMKTYRDLRPAGTELYTRLPVLNNVLLLICFLLLLQISRTWEILDEVCDVVYLIFKKV